MKKMNCVILLTVLFASGCTQVSVKKNPGPDDDGIRYYRPKPYLLILPGAPSASSTPSLELQGGLDVNLRGSVPTQETDGTEGEEPIGLYGKGAHQPISFPSTSLVRQDLKPLQRVSVSMEYMPDFSEEYSVKLRPGLGVGKLNMTLENGWNLTAVGIETDQQTDEIITSVANLFEKVAAAAGDSDSSKDEILSRNVPMGFYEAVIACDPNGRKQFYGWRYIGFMPFNGCPTQMGGMSTQCCNGTSVYGLIWDPEINALAFQELGRLEHDPRFALRSKPILRDEQSTNSAGFDSSRSLNGW